MNDTPAYETLASTACFGGRHLVIRHQSQATGTAMEAALYLPPQSASGPESGPKPVVYYLSGLTCTWENAANKAGAQRYAAERGLILVFPDTSPRGKDAEDRSVADDANYDLGQGAGFYLDATEEPWAPHFRMESYLVQDLLPLIDANFPTDPGRRGLTGHSMGGHGALTLAMRHPDLFRSVSAFAPIVAPSLVPWGQKAFTAYLGEDRSRWAEHDATELVASRGWQGDILIDQGTDDQFLEEQLQPLLFEKAATAAGVPLTLRLQAGYDHSYWFVQSFIGEHLAWHAQRLG